jgi:arylsulfatase A-like enzyme
MNPTRTALALALWLAQGLAAWAAQDRPRRPPNVLILYSDDQRHDTIAALGNKHIRTPNLDRLVKNGFTFTHTFVTVPVCTPSRAELLTGRCAFRNGVRFFAQKVQPDLPQLQQAFGRAGYRTWFTGKWHNDGTPSKHGFAEVRRLFVGGMGKHEKVFVEGDKKVSGFSSQLFADAALDRIKTKPDRPWLMLVAFTAPHDPRTPPGKYAMMYDPAKLPLPPNYMPEHPFDNGEMVVRDELLERWPRTQEAVRRHLADYYGMISHLDEQVGRVLEALEQSGQLDNTIVIFLSDNGLAIGSHGLMGKQSLYEHSIRVPFIVSGPGIPRGRESSALVYNYDIFPTLCDLAGIAIPKQVEGKSLAPILRGEAKSVRDHVCSAYQDVQRMVRTERWKLIHYPKLGRTQVFDLKEDPHEIRDLLVPWRLKATKAYTPPVTVAEAQRVVEDLRGRLAEWQRAVGDTLRLDIDPPALKEK